MLLCETYDLLIYKYRLIWIFNCCVSGSLFPCDNYQIKSFRLKLKSYLTKILKDL